MQPRRWLSLGLVLLCAPATADEVSPHGRWAAGLLGGFNTVRAPDDLVQTPIGLGPGTFIRGGLQWNELLDVELELGLGSLVFSFFARAALMAGITEGWFSLSVGPVVVTNNSGGPDAGGASATYGAACARVDVHLWRHLLEYGRRWAITVSLAGEYGVAVQQLSCCPDRPVRNGVAWGVYAAIGPSWY